MPRIDAEAPWTTLLAASLYAKTAPAAVHTYAHTHEDRLAALSVREALKNM